MHKTLTKYLWWILLTGVLIFFLNLDVLHVNIMEARNFVTAREMVHDGNWLLTTMNAEPRYEKPPLPTWLTAISGIAFGMESLFALRLPAALITLLLLYFFFKLIPKLEVSLKQSFLATLILATSFYIIFAGRNGQWDIFTHSFMMGGIYFLWKFFSSTEGLYKNGFLAAFFIGLSFLSKGPVSLFALLLPFLIAYGTTYKFTSFRNRLKPFLVFLLIALAVSAWWFIYVRVFDPIAFLKVTSVETSRWANYNVKPFYYYWSFFTQSGIWTIPAFVGLLYPYLKNKVSNKRAYVFSMVWTLSAVILLSIIPEKKARYLLPVMIPLALNTSFYIEYLFRRFQSLPRKESWVVYFNFALIACIGIAFPVGAPFFLKLDGYWSQYFFTSIVLFGIGAAIIYFLIKKKFPQVFYLTVGFICGIMAVGFPLANALLHNPDFRNFSELQTNKPVGLKIYEYDHLTPEIIWEYGEPIPRIYDKDSIRFPQEEKFGLLIIEKDTSELKKLENSYSIQPSGRYDLNYVNPEKRGYKSRLIRRFYVLEKKE